GIGNDYSLFMVTRFREELRRTPSVEEALVATVATAGRAVFFSGMVVVIGLAGLLTFKYMMLRSIGLGGALVVVVAVLAANTLLPAFLALVGRRIDAFRVIPQRGAGSGWWRRLAEGVAARPWPVFLGTLLALLALGAPFLRVRLGSPDVSILPPQVESRQGFDVLWEKFGPGEVSPILVVLEVPEGSVFQRDRVGALYDFVQEIARKEGVVRVNSIVSLDSTISRGQYQLLFSRPLDEIPLSGLRSSLRYLAGGRVTVVQVVSEYMAVDPQAQRLVEEIRALAPPADMRMYVGGATAELTFIVTEMYTQFPRALALIMVLTYLALLFLFGSVVLPLKAIIMDSLSILASYGALVIVFQDGYFADLLRFSPQGYVDATVPIVMFCVLFGLSMDYEVFMLSRVKEYYEATGDNGQSVALGLEHTGRLITGAALIVVIVAGSFAFADILIIKAVGLGTALAILLDATVVRALLVPATMHILGESNWWAPAFVRRLVPTAVARERSKL
ncbi:MAG: MMPL family transporter, partial [Chloroflexi bacterium]|nr:MMPL family transporter [Chloroflexota bacterium]